EPAVAAHRAVDAVLMAAERFVTGDRHAVHLQFSVGGTDLSVRVELRGEEVRTTFRTDSPELRNALAHEWESASSGSPDHSVRLSSPVFSSNDSAAFSGDTASRQRDAHARRGDADDLFSAVASRARSSGALASVTSAFAAPTARVTAPS